MQNKGQFSIIAALLVAVVLIATVIITYSTIRNFPTEGHPQVLNAIDETNLALKKILGFTVGYYGSILQVTGDVNYANASAHSYFMSGLEYIARMHPDWAVSFNLANMDLQAYWFKTQSYSKGNISVEYDLTGLEIYNIKYEISCKLSVNILGTDGNQARIRVTADEKNEPLINLGRSSFKFYLYRYTNSTWATITPTTEPVAFANGTYLIDLPPGIDSYSYVVQVEDPRGIVTVASSFNRYVCTLNWNPNATLIDRESFEGNWPPFGWSFTGNWHKTGEEKHDGNYSAKFEKSGNVKSGNLTTCNLNCANAVSIYVEFWYLENCEANEFLLQYYNGTTWKTITDLGNASDDGQWHHYEEKITDNQFFNSNFKIQWSAINFRGNKEAYIDYVTVKKEIILPEQSEPLVVELLQNGTMRWLGQNLALTTQAKPIPPIPVKAIHINQTVNGVNREAPFQIEDWASNYRVPLGLTNNASIFNNRNMLVFLVNPNVTQVTIWWDGSDRATQTPLAYTNNYFTYNTNQRTISNGILNLQIDFSDQTFKAISSMGSTIATAVLMRINQDTAHYGWSEPMYSVLDGTIRTVLHHEVEWPNGGVSGCPNVYAHIVLTLPANATYYTYQLRLMFLDSQQPRNISDLCPITLSYSGEQTQTENGTEISTSTGLFYNLSASCWQHHWSQITSASGTKGTGIMFTDTTNQMLYFFDNIAENKTGALNIASDAIELCPVTSMAPASFQYALDITWYGAVVTFDGTTPIYKQDGSGLWMTVEYPPTITVTTES